MRRAQCVLAIVAGILPAARAHEAFAEYVWHRVQISVNARHVDVTVELTFFEEWSSRERQRMDADQDGRIRRAEMDDYASQLGARVNKEVILLVAGRRVPLIPLYAAELNLLGRDTVEGGHHQLTLRFFAPTPKELSTGSAITVEDRLWPEARCLAEISTTRDGVGLLDSGKVTERPFPPSSNDPLRFTAHYIKPVGAPLPTP